MFALQTQESSERFSCAPKRVLLCKPCFKTNAEIFEIAEKRVLRFAFYARIPNRRNFSHGGPQAQWLHDAFKIERMTHFFPMNGLHQLGGHDAEAKGHVGESCSVEH